MTRKRRWHLAAGAIGAIGAALRLNAPWRPGCLLLVLGLGLGFGGALAGEPVPVLFQSGRGRFEVAAPDAEAARVVTSAAEDLWRTLAGPLALPDAFSSPILVRLMPPTALEGRAPFRTVVEVGGLVTVHLAWAGQPVGVDLQRALVQGLLLRLAVSHHGFNERLVVPLWLEFACVGWSQTRLDAAWLDALKQESAQLAVPGLGGLLGWARGGEEPRPFVVGSVWLLTVLQAEAGRSGAWTETLKRLLAGDEPERVLAAHYGVHFANDRERELWWQTCWHHHRRVRSLPNSEPAEARTELAALARFVFMRDETETVVPLAEVLARADEPIVAAELKRRAGDLKRMLASIHPFFRNAGLSLLDALEAGRAGMAERAAREAAFQRDWADAVELAEATTAALDALEKRSGATRSPMP